MAERPAEQPDGPSRSGPGRPAGGDRGGQLVSWRLLARVVGATLALAVVVVLFHRTVFAWPALFWPPGGERWFTLAMVWLLSLVVPAMGGAALGGVAYDRFV